MSSYSALARRLFTISVPILDEQLVIIIIYWKQKGWDSISVDMQEKAVCSLGHILCRTITAPKI